MFRGISSHCRKCHRAATQDWRERNPEYLEQYNQRRRGEYAAEHPRPSRPCVVCGELHSRQPRALVCSERCRNRRKYEQRKASAAA
jgi:predicted nucleic acid-binding Zn ribbon protein